jgi:hypothetical protein
LLSIDRLYKSKRLSQNSNLMRRAKNQLLDGSQKKRKKMEEN